MTWENQANSLAAFFPSLGSFGLLDLPVGLSKAPCRAVFNHDKTYLSTFHSRRHGLLILIISKSLKVVTARRFLTDVWGDSFDWILARRQPMTRAKPGEFAHNYEAWSSLLCTALHWEVSTISADCVPVKTTCLHRHATSASVASGSSSHAAFTRTMAADIKLVAGKRDEKRHEIWSTQMWIQSWLSRLSISRPILSRHRPTGAATAVKTVE